MIDMKDVDFDDIEIEYRKYNRDNHHRIMIKDLMVKLPSCFYNGDWKKTKDSKIKLYLTCYDEQDDVKPIIDFFTKLEKWCIKQIHLYKHKFPNIEQFRQVIKSVDENTMNEPKDMYIYGLWDIILYDNTLIYDNKHNKLDIQYVQENLLNNSFYLSALLKIDCIWVDGNKFGIHMEPLQLCIDSNVYPLTINEEDMDSEDYEL